MEVAILSDTHVPTRADEVPRWVSERVRAADHVVHAGDFDSAEAYDEVAELAADLTAVKGNMDPVALELPETATVELGGATFVVTHGTGAVRNYEERVAGIVAEKRDDVGAPVVGVAGHTHRVFDGEAASAGGESVRLLNPGSATGADPADEATMMTVEAVDGEVDVTVRRG
ncbi:metallophosphoesterase family protein [Halostella sp. JP-L12]|uniref:metallophosphoesterase family protein n=1 Tax=Halostella TaxID=1843185 RepID=UPI000EF7C835|nr:MULTISPECIES: metallophosphoesterase family protein [Halostella]NHN48148.1 metallophosphoesterase family protein [Halostella sp. JP-L12]